MFKEELKGYKNAFVFGTGGGNDIVSSMLIAMYLQKQGISTDIGGVLSPGAIHTFNGNLESVVNLIEGDVTRRIDCKNPVPISFIDGALPNLAKMVGVKVNNFYDLSIRYGSTALVRGVNDLIEENNYDLVVAVDMGGDILGRGIEDKTILSPIMDFSSLYLLGELDIDSLLIEFGLGTDGELRPQGMDEIIHELYDTGLIYSETNINGSDREVKKFKELFEKIKEIRVGHATVKTLETFDNIGSKTDMASEYRFISQVGKKKWKTSFEVVLPHQYFGKAYAIDGKKLAKQREKTSFRSENSLELYVKLKEVETWKTELDLLYLWSEDNWTTPKQEGECMLLLAPSKLISDKDRHEIVNAGVAQLKENKCDLALILKDDLRYISSDVESVIEADNFALISSKVGINDFLEETAKKIKGYQTNY